MLSEEEETKAPSRNEGSVDYALAAFLVEKAQKLDREGSYILVLKFALLYSDFMQQLQASPVQLSSDAEENMNASLADEIPNVCNEFV